MKTENLQTKAAHVIASASFARATSNAKKAALFLSSVAGLLAGDATLVRGQSALEGFPEKITFYSIRDGNFEVYVMNPDGSSQTRLTTTTADDSFPAFSPDGTRIAFFSTRDGSQEEIYIMNADGTNQTRLTNNTARDNLPAFSPDGTRIAFRSDRDGNYEIYVMDVDGSNVTRLTTNPELDTAPSFSPDGSRIAFHSWRDHPGGPSEIYVMNADGTNQTRLTNNTSYDDNPAFSRDGQRIAFQSARDGNFEIYVMNADGTNPTRLTNNTVFDTFPTYSPDGERIAFESQRDGNSEIYVMNADGTNPVRLTNNAVNDANPDWVGPTPTPTPTPPPAATVLGNISTRLLVETGDNALIGGFIITGTQPKKIIVRAIGPSLASFFPGALADPSLELRNSSGGLIASNDNWRSDNEAEILATGIPPSNDLESAIVATLPANTSAYTAIVRGVNNETGIGVVEAYDLDQTVDSKLANISTRGFVQTGDNVLIGGLIVLGQNPFRVIVRAIGPSLPLPGVLQDPMLELRDGNGALVVSNDNWRSDQETEIIATTIPPSNDLESAIVRNLEPGNYTAIVRGVNNNTGIAVIEAYGLNIAAPNISLGEPQISADAR